MSYILPVNCESLFNPALQSQSRNTIVSSLISLKDDPSIIKTLISDSWIKLLMEGRCSSITLTPLGERGKVGVPYLLRKLELTGTKTYILKTSSYTPYSSIKKVTKDSENNLCLAGDINIDLALDEFTNELLIGYILRNVFETTGMKSLAVTYDYGGAYENTGGIIMEYADIGNLISVVKYPQFMTDGLVRVNILEGIISQVLTTIHFLGQDSIVQFTSGDLKMENILVFNRPMRGTYFSLNVSCPITCKIGDFGKSSCIIRKTDGSHMKIYNRSLLADAYMLVASFHPKIYTTSEGENYYIVDDTTTAQTYVWMRHSGIGYYRSFDYYTFMVSLLSMREYYLPFFTSRELIEKFWSPMWMEAGDGELCKEAIREKIIKNERIGTTEAIELLKNKKLKCGLIENIVQVKSS